MAQTAFDQQLTIAAPAAAIRERIAAIDQIGQFHPLIISVAEIAPDVSAFGTPRRNYRVTDRMPLGPLRLRFTYLATATSPDDTSLHCEAFQSPGVHLVITYRFVPDGTATRVEEHCAITAPRLLLGTVRRQAQAAHRATLAHIKTTLEAPAGN
jgi:hypothetical protein